MEDTPLVRTVLREHSVTAVLHLAASAHAAESMAAPLAYFSNNVSATLALLEAMAAEGVKQVVFASSCAVYGNSQLAQEDEAPAPCSPYGESKWVAEKMLHWFARARDFRFVALRYFNVAGAAEGLGERCASSTRILPRAVYASLTGGPPLNVFGTDLPTEDGTAVRDYVNVDDVARANQLALQYVSDGGGGEVINIGSGRGTSVFDIVQAVAAQTGRKPAYIRKAARNADPACVVAEITRAQRILGWQPLTSDLHTMVRSVVHACESQRSNSI